MITVFDVLHADGAMLSSELREERGSHVHCARHIKLLACATLRHLRCIRLWTFDEELAERCPQNVHAREKPLEMTVHVVGDDSWLAGGLVLLRFACVQPISAAEFGAPRWSSATLWLVLLYVLHNIVLM